MNPEIFLSNTATNIVVVWTNNAVSLSSGLCTLECWVETASDRISATAKFADEEDMADPSCFVVEVQLAADIAESRGVFFLILTRSGTEEVLCRSEKSAVIGESAASELLPLSFVSVS